MDNGVPPVLPPHEESGGFVGEPGPATPQPPQTPSTSNAPVKSGGIPRKAIATIFGILLLVGGVGAGIVLVQRQQVLKQKAALPPECTGVITCNEKTAVGGAPAPISILCSAFPDQTTCEQQNVINPRPGFTCTGACSWTTPTTTSTGGGSTSLTGTICANNCCQIDSGAASTFVIKQCTCDNISGPCLQSCHDAGGPGSKICISAPSCGAAQLDIFNGTADTGLAVRAPAANNCTTTLTGGPCSSDYCAGPDQCRAQGGTPGNQGPRPSGGNCATNTVMCCGLGASNTTPASTPSPCGPLGCINSQCGGGCIVTADCAKSPTGAPVWCKPNPAGGGTCVNANCPNNTTAGANCDCSGGFFCGQQSHGPCDTGMSVFVNVAGGDCSGAATYCVGAAPDWATTGKTLEPGYTIATCNPPNEHGQYLVGPNGQTTGLTSAQIASTCASATASCSSVTAYDTNWNALSVAQLSQLSAGKVVRFAVTGTTSSGNFDKARFMINGTQGPDVTTQNATKPGQFYYDYTIPTGVTSFTVSGQIHQQQLNSWF